MQNDDNVIKRWGKPILSLPWVGSKDHEWTAPASPMGPKLQTRARRVFCPRAETHALAPLCEMKMVWASELCWETVQEPAYRDSFWGWNGGNYPGKTRSSPWPGNSCCSLHTSPCPQRPRSPASHRLTAAGSLKRGLPGSDHPWTRSPGRGGREKFLQLCMHYRAHEAVRA